MISLLLAVAMAVYRPAFNDVVLVATLYSGVLAYTLAGLVLWGTRKARAQFGPARLQAKLAIVIAAPGTVLVYLLLALAEAQPSS